MSRVNRSDSLDGGPNTQGTTMNTIEEFLEQLVDLGYLEIPREPSTASLFDHIQPSEKAKSIAKRVRKRVLSRLGLADLGAYIAYERERKGIERAQLSKRIRLAREVLAQLETSRLEFFKLTPQKAADLVEVLSLDPKIVFSYLSNGDLSYEQDRTPAPLFRIDREVPETERRELEQKSQDELAEGEVQKQRLEKFLQEFVQELSHRGLLR